MSICPIPGFSVAAHTRHALHGDATLWPEKNCYVDLWIELLHALGADPHAMLGPALAIDFEGDQWTFFKPSHDALRTLYGIDVQELTVWRPLLDHAVEHLGAGKLISVEADAFWLPDTAGTDYRQKHSKTTIVLAELDVAAQRLGYFHNAGVFTLEGEDFRRSFRLDDAGRPLQDPAHLPLFAEVLRLDRLRHRPTGELRALAATMLRQHLAQRPAGNPVPRFAERFERDLPALRAAGLDHYHAWAFGTVRQCGAAFELTSRQLDWLADGAADPAGLRHAAAHFERVAQGAKTLILKAARAVASPRPVSLQELFDTMAAGWDEGMAALANHGPSNHDLAHRLPVAGG